MADKITVLLADDHALVRKGFRRMLEDDRAIIVVGEASDGNEAVRLALELRPNVTVMDCALPGVNGIEATRQIRAKKADATVLTPAIWISWRRSSAPQAGSWCLTRNWPSPRR
jgi:DNA-binding NarL/FixJ family response regulator